MPHKWQNMHLKLIISIPSWQVPPSLVPTFFFYLLYILIILHSRRKARVTLMSCVICHCAIKSIKIYWNVIWILFLIIPLNPPNKTTRKRFYLSSVFDIFIKDFFHYIQHTSHIFFLPIMVIILLYKAMKSHKEDGNIVPEAMSTTVCIWIA